MVHSVYKLKCFFGKHLFTVLDKGSKISTISPTTALENVQLSPICS